jgi:hypothetical protein
VPPERWTPAQVAALAPDGNSLAGARVVSGSGRWTAPGWRGDVLWGQCRDYQVGVDLGGPAYRCSCPSRKVPCKHALGLLLLWVDGAVGDAEPPDWVTQWRAARAARAAAPKAPPDPVAAARRAQQRVERVEAGLTELRQWLDDQVRQGLARFAETGHRPIDAMAARLVDAQAPAAASAVRRLGNLAGLGPQWADRMLGELGLLRLLVAAWERRAELPAGLAATVRTRIGFPVSTEDVLAGPRVRDRWQVLGQVDTDDGTLMTRRIWLRGADGGRFALLLSFAALGQELVSDLVPGTELEADLCFYPGALPLRALVSARHSTPVPLTAPAGAVPVRGALAGWATALAAEPWRFDVPVLLGDVVPAGDGWLVDAAGESMPLAPGHRAPWWLLAAAGGAPVTVAGEWSPAGLRPLAAWPEGRYVPAAPGVPEFGVGRDPELPGELLATALVGTARRPWTPVPRPSSASLGSEPGATPRDAGPEPHAGRVATAGSGPSGLLESAAISLIYRRAGVMPSTGHAPVPAAPPETESPVRPAAGARLLRILGDGGAPGGAAAAQELLVQWLTLAAAHGGHAPPEALPALFDAGRRNTAIRPALARVAGRRGTWLAGMRADWEWLLDEAPGGAAGADPELWETGSAGERLAWLTQLRRRDPAAAAEVLAGAWDTETPDDRARFLPVLDDHLSSADEPLLEHALDDRRREVREEALDLLRRLPGSAFAARMTARARAAVRLGGDSTLVVDPPDQLDTTLRRDGVGATPVRGVGVSAWLLEEIVAGTPLDVWTGDLTRTPAEVLALARGHDWETALLHGFAKAAIAQRDSGWATALVANDTRDPTTGLRESIRWDLHLLLPPGELTRIAAEFLRRDDHLANRLLAIHTGEWPHELAVAVLETIDRRARTDRHSWQLAELCRSAALAMPPAYVGHVTLLADRLDQDPTQQSRVRPVADLARTLTFRHEMQLEFA